MSTSQSPEALIRDQHTLEVGLVRTDPYTSWRFSVDRADIAIDTSRSSQLPAMLETMRATTSDSLSVVYLRLLVQRHVEVLLPEGVDPEQAKTVQTEAGRVTLSTAEFPFWDPSGRHLYLANGINPDDPNEPAMISDRTITDASVLPYGAIVSASRLLNARDGDTVPSYVHNFASSILRRTTG